MLILLWLITNGHLEKILFKDLKNVDYVMVDILFDMLIEHPI